MNRTHSVLNLKQTAFTKTIAYFLSWLVFLFILVVVAPLVVEKIFFDTKDSLHTTKYVLIGYFVFFLLTTGVIFPLMRELSLGSGKTAKVLFYLCSAFPLLILILTVKFVLFLNEDFKYRYKFINFASSVAIFLLGTWPRYHGRRNKEAPFLIFNHTSEIDYFYGIQAMGGDPFNIVAGINLARNKKGFSNWLTYWTIGKLVEKYSISVDRNDSSSRKDVAPQMDAERERGKDVGIFPEGGRNPYKNIQEGIILLPFKKSVFELAWERKEAIQPVVFDFPAIWKGKDDTRSGIHPCTIHIFYLPIVNPLHFQTVDEFKEVCWQAMYSVLRKSRRVKYLQN